LFTFSIFPEWFNWLVLALAAGFCIPQKNTYDDVHGLRSLGLSGILTVIYIVIHTVFL
jgi:hypothetical protein